MRMVLGASVFYLALVLQSAVAPQLMFAGAPPRLIPLAACLVAALCQPRSALCLAAAGGFAADCLSPGPFGLETAGGALAVACMLQARRIGLDGWPPVLLPLSIAVLLESMLAATGQLLTAERGVEPARLADFVLRSTLATFLVASVLIVAVRGVSPNRDRRPVS